MDYLDGAASDSCFHNTQIMTLFVTSGYRNILCYISSTSALGLFRYKQMKPDGTYTLEIEYLR